MQKSTKITKDEKANGGQHIMMCGHEFVVRPPQIIDPYERILFEVNGIAPIVGPTAPNLKAHMAMLAARLKAGLLSQEVYDKLLSEIRGQQVESMLSDENGDAAGIIAAATVRATLHAFARDKDGELGLQSYAFRAALRECFSESGFFVKQRGSRERFREGIGVWPLFLRLERNGEPLMVPDAVESRPVHVWAGGKPCDSICQFERVDTPWTIKVMLEARHDSPLKLQDALGVLSLLRTIGLGAQRSMGYGRCEIGGVSDVIQARTTMALVKPGMMRNDSTRVEQ